MCIFIFINYIYIDIVIYGYMDIFIMWICINNSCIHYPLISIINVYVHYIYTYPPYIQRFFVDIMVDMWKWFLKLQKTCGHYLVGYVSPT